ncbi:AAA family ATPase [Candidatus Falkowbacteria bacterium]|uniref:Helicase n=1 Tax=Candidatus Buchananbacteria bacterium CG10_big_fil_rev_8_21_14_0_10_33_19 TaxID=1974525 RepID=A0A2H0W3Q8_9BACT|nr:AAA family ATPase [Candidatus Falkowbacteria bacterium]PIS05995.1 MAG: helicase [Candidatus Buchananbacteria bacterium CG10_big_fil_rev_8_21_14_0_10_33_19]
MDQKTAFNILKLGQNVCLTGPAGSGKTYLLNKYINYLKSKGVAVGVTASTGIAATHMNGMTIHSWSGMGVHDSISNKEMRKILKKRHLVNRLKSAKVLIIDEVSMLHSFQLDLINQICRRFKNDDRPFGGIQVIMCGDFFQLPPVSNTQEKSNFISESDIWQNMDLKICYLDEQHRQEDKTLIKILNGIRSNTCDQKLISKLEINSSNSEFNTDTTKLYTHNIDVDSINELELNNIAGKTFCYSMRYNGKEALAEALKKGCLAPEKLYIKKGAKVMFVKNNFEAGYVNGTLGYVVDFSEEGFPIVETYSDKQIVAAPMSWIIEDEGSIKAEIVQIPLRLAWAITVHKSQGMSLDSAEIDLSKSFVQGMGYVALSRVRTLSGIKLKGINKMALRVNEEVLELDKQLLANSQEAKERIRTLSASALEKDQQAYLNSILPTEKEKAVSIKKVPGATYLETKNLLDKGLSIKEIANRRGMTDSTIFGHLEKLRARGDELNIEHLRPDSERFSTIQTAFEHSGGRSLTPVREILGESFSYQELRIVRLFMDQF